MTPTGSRSRLWRGGFEPATYGFEDRRYVVRNSKLGFPKNMRKLLPRWADFRRNDVFVDRMPHPDMPGIGSVDIWMCGRRCHGYFATANGFTARGDSRDEAQARLVQQLYAARGEDVTVRAGRAGEVVRPGRRTAEPTAVAKEATDYKDAA